MGRELCSARLLGLCFVVGEIDACRLFLRVLDSSVAVYTIYLHTLRVRALVRWASSIVFADLVVVYIWFACGFGLRCASLFSVYEMPAMLCSYLYDTQEGMGSAAIRRQPLSEFPAESAAALDASVRRLHR